MSTRYIPLDRRFEPYVEEDADPQDIARLLDSNRASTWSELLDKRRVVLLAEPGSGKTAELQEQARRLREAGKFSFYATLENVGRFGLRRAIRVQQRLDAWRDSGEHAWFFLDSVDEAKHARVRLVDVLEAIAADIIECEGRARIVLSGRHTDWEFRNDLRQLTSILPLPPSDEKVGAINPNALIVRFVRNERAPQTPEPAEIPLVVVMEPLDDKRIQRFAKENGVTDVEASPRHSRNQTCCGSPLLRHVTASRRLPKEGISTPG